MRNVKSEAKGVTISRVRKGIPSCLLVSAAALGLLATNDAVAQTCTPPPPNMVSWWPGDGNANDIEDGNNGTLLGGVSFSAAEVGQGFTFNSNVDGVTIPHNPNLNVQSPGFSADFWMRGIKNQPDSFLSTIFEKSHGWVDATGWAFQVETLTGAPRFAIGDGSGFPEVIGTADVLDGNFHHIAGIWDGTVLRLYVDGVLQSGTAFNSTPANNGRAVNIGFTWGGGTPQRFFRGTADELEIFNRALTQTEVQAIYNAGGAGKCKPVCTAPPPNMVSWWPGDGNANDIQDSNNGTLQTGTTFAPGKVGQAFSFNGSGFVDVPHNDNQNTGAQITVDAWIYMPNPLGTGFTTASIINKRSPSDNEGYTLELVNGFGGDSRNGFQPVNNGLQFEISTSNGSLVNAITGSNVIGPGQWYHVAGTYDGLAVRVFVNGSEVAIKPITGNINAVTDDLIIGKNVVNGASFPGLIDEVELFNRALTQLEIQSIYNAGSAGKCKPTPSYVAQVQQPINPDGSSVFTVRRGVVPVKFTLTQGGVATCALPPATIAVTRTAGATTGAVDESVYSGSADTGSNFRIDGCQYVYNLSASALGIGTYRVDIKINGQVVGSAIFQLK